MKILIIGAGIGGLCAGLALRRLGHDIEIFEKVREMRPVGAGLSLWPNGIRCLQHLGLGPDVEALGGQMETMAYVDGLSGAGMTDFSLQPLYDASGARAYPVSRAALQDRLIDRFGREEIHFGAELLTAAQDGTATFSNGMQAQGDLIIGADGAHSAIRSHILGSPLSRRSAGYTNWNGIVPADPAIAPVTSWTTYVGEGKRVSIMPIGAGKCYYFFDVPRPAGGEAPADRLAELRGHFSHWCQPVQCLLDAISTDSLNRVEIHDIDPIGTWVNGRMVLLGDSAHNTAPDLGQGACMAMEDAVVLERALTQYPDDLDAALASYQAARVDRCAELVLRARVRSDITHGIDPALTKDWYRSLTADAAGEILQGIQKTVDGGPLAV
ncbi:FAD-dependent urate hydroxylase HpxO [Falsirhodobacter sp. alg1]|uniref:FAD-dependent urate hydroxylase HpxO n=1 Tax=Falsirhodobacter sp. alg1 TaxID=1472418 RepID=UPI0007877E76|nr:FAD-dependent urate hydroxylase HpxO [Falsirhodobacter sp. alg1]